MFRVLKRIREFGINIRKNYACQHNLTSKQVNEKSSESKTIIESQEIKFFQPSQNQGYDEFKKKYNFKYPNRCNNLLQAITWSTALIFGFYTSQLVCLYKRKHRFDNQEKCSYTKFFCIKNQQLHKKFLFTPYEHKKQNYVEKESNCNLHVSDRNKLARILERIYELKKYDDKINIAGQEEFFENRFQNFFDDDILQFGLHHVNNDKSKARQNEKQDITSITQDDEVLENAFSCITKIIGEIELQLGIECIRAGNFEGAVEHFKMSTNSNNNSACFNLALLYEHGLGVQQDLFMAKKLYELAANGGHKEALYNLGVFFAQGIGTRKDYRKAIICFQKSAKLGDASSVIALRMIHSSKEKKLSEPDDFIDADTSSMEIVINN